MDTPSAGPDQAVRSLSAGAREWIRLHAGYLDSPAAQTELPVTPRVKALLQLALLCRYWRLSAPQDPALAEVTAVVRHAWQRPEFPRLIALDPAYARQFQLMYGALAPPGTTGTAHRAGLGRLAADGYLTPRRKSPYLHLETRFYADLAGVGHRLASYPELYAASALAGAAGRPAADLEVCNVTHTLFYLSDFGHRDPGLTGQAREQARAVVDRLTDLCVRGGDWDLVGKLVLAQHCLGLDPLRTRSGAAGLRLLARVQTAEGAIPGKSLAERAAADATPVQFFRRAYQSTVVTTLTTLIVSGNPSGSLSAAGSTAGRGAW